MVMNAANAVALPRPPREALRVDRAARPVSRRAPVPAARPAVVKQALHQPAPQPAPPVAQTVVHPIAEALRPVAEAPAPHVEPLDFSAIYKRWFHPVCRWARALGAADEEIEDIAQDVFLIVQRRLPEFKNDNLAGWLYRITARSTRDQRRRAWFRRLVRVNREESLQALAEPRPSHAGCFAARQTLERLLDGMGEKKRAVLMLYEAEGYTGEEIAELEEISIDTVWSRLRHAREDIRGRIERMQKRGEL